MIHFRDYEEYVSVRNKRKEKQENQKKWENQEEGETRETQETREIRETRRNRTELVMEDNTIYEIDTECEECLKIFWRQKAEEKAGQ